MQTRPFGRTGWATGEIGFGTWALGADWGAVDDAEGIRALHEALDHGVNFLDTADVYGDGRSERLIAQALKGYSGPRPIIATKAGRRLKPFEAAGFTRENLNNFVDRSLRNLGVEAIDLLQLHCPPTDVYYRPDVFDTLDDLVSQGKIIHYGASVEKVEEAIKAVEYPGVVSIQIIFNIFRQRPAEAFFKMARQREVAIIVRVPWQAACSAASTSPTASSRPAIIATTTATAKPSTSARPFPAFPTTSDWPRWRRSVRLFLPGQPWRNSPCAGS